MLLMQLLMQLLMLQVQVQMQPSAPYVQGLDAWDCVHGPDLLLLVLSVVPPHLLRPP